MKITSGVRRAFPILAASLAACAPLAAQAPADGANWFAHVKVLAADDMEGRDTGSRGLEKAQAYVIAQLKAAGLEPAGTQGFFQPIDFESRTLREAESSVVLVRNGKAEPLLLGEDGLLSSDVDEVPEVSAPLVFAGYGLTIPEAGHDDLAGLDLRGKVAVYITGSPAGVSAALSAHYQTTEQRWGNLRRAGAIGMMSIVNPASMEAPWVRFSMMRLQPRMNLLGAEFDDATGRKLAFTVNPAHADKILAGSGHTFAEIAELAKVRKPMPHFAFATTVKAKTRFTRARLTSSNIIARLPGSDPALAAEHVVLSAHLDHIGIGASSSDDKIYNGAMDNASGCAVLLDVAAALKRNGQRPRRSLLFAFVTAEEKGLLGSRYFASRPTVDAKSLVADVNVDMMLPLTPLKVLTAYGLAESDLGDRLAEAARPHGVSVQPDPHPLLNIFIRSDQYYFIRRGVPSLMFDPAGATPDEDKVYTAWIRQHYHSPSDDGSYPLELPTAGKYEDIVRDLVMNVADGPARPQWKPESFFRRYAGGN